MSTEIELASKKNADLTRWDWDDDSRQEWKKARPAIQEFYKKWHDSFETVLSHEVDIGHVPGFESAPNQFIVRNSYKITFDRIWQRAFIYPWTAVVLTGQPGIGKVSLLLSLWATLYLFYDNDVWSPKTQNTLPFPIAKKVEDLRTVHKLFLFVLIDQDVLTSEPRPGLVFGNHIFPIQASSPNPSRFKRWAKKRNAAIWGLPLWDETELNVALRLQPEYPAFKALLEESMRSKDSGAPAKAHIKAALDTLEKWTEKKNRLFKDLRTDDDSYEVETKRAEEEDKIYRVDISTIDGALEVLVHAAIQDSGPVARDVYECIFLPPLALKNRANTIAVVTYENLQVLSKSFQAEFTFPEQSISHRIITVDPVPDDSVDAYEQFYDEWKIEYQSIQIVRDMAQKLEKEKDKRLAELYGFFRSSTQSSILASSIHEHISHRTLRTDARRNLDLVQMRGDITVDAPVLVTDFEKDERSDERLPGRDRREVHFRGPDFSSPTTEDYYIPQRSNFPLFDSFLVEQQNNKVTLWVFQMSVSLVHGGSREGFNSRLLEKKPTTDHGLAYLVILVLEYQVKGKDM
ncbi:hypothetical protein Clacol_001306 [Clathrus columnatus]|uniref:Uncharacterized protein n=1 Tax=Clathrus columnatus TaxID=1419009 RepID=A0AAV5A267_9AGAM|nr:hypothetical protein Clacol_001306 [Clathrus columnatus]